MRRTRQWCQLGVTLGLSTCLALMDLSAQSSDPTAKDVELKPAPKMAVPQIQDQDSDNLQSLPAMDAMLRSNQNLSVDEFRLRILQQEMEFNPELKEKVEAVLQVMKERQDAEQAKQPDEKEKNFNGWIFDNLRLMYESQGKELPDLIKLAEEGNKANTDASQDGYQDPLTEWRKGGTKMAKITGLTEEGMDGRDRLSRTSMSMLGTSLAERLRANRDRMAEAKEAFDPMALGENGMPPDPMEQYLQSPTEGFDPFAILDGSQQTAEGESDSDLMTWEGEQLQADGEQAEILAEIEGDSAKETFQPGELQWFENADDTLPVASPEQRMVMNQGLIQGEMDMYMEKIKELNEELMAKEAEIVGDLDDYTLSERNLNRPNIDIPMEQFIEQASRDKQQIRKAEQIQSSLQKSKENRTKMLRPSMDIHTTQRLMTPHDLLGPGAFRAWEREKNGKERRPDRRRDPRDDPSGQNLN